MYRYTKTREKDTITDIISSYIIQPLFINLYDKILIKLVSLVQRYSIYVSECSTLEVRQCEAHKCKMSLKRLSEFIIRSP